MLGQKVGQYKIIDRLGKGGMGHVYRALDEMLGREVALKIINSPEDQSAARLRAEAAALARLDHKGITTIHALIEDDGRLVMAMELVRGRTLQQLLEQLGVFAPSHAAALCMQTLAILEHAHMAGVVHRDLKPSNLMLTDSGAIKIMDFGIARLTDSMGLTNAGAMIGTPAYMAPEQVLGQPVDARTDVYAMGVVFFRLVTAAFPFKGQTPFEMTQSQVNDPPARPTDIRPELPAWVDDIVLRALAKKPADRFQSAIQFQAAIAGAIAMEPEPDLAQAAAVEVTEVMPRPDFSGVETPSALAVDQSAEQEAEQKAPVQKATRRAQPHAFWRIAAAIVVVLGVVLWLKPFRASAPESTTTESTVPPADPSSAPADLAAVDAPVSTKAAIGAPAGSTAKPQPASSPAPAAAAPARAPLSFNEVKLLAVDGARATISDVALLLAESEVRLQIKDAVVPDTTLPYRGITKATYTLAKDPKWDAKLSAPAEKINVPGIGMLSRSRHWLVLQGPDRYLILRLDGDDRAAVMQAFEERVGVVIDGRK